MKPSASNSSPTLSFDFSLVFTRNLPEPRYCTLTSLSGAHPSVSLSPTAKSDTLTYRAVKNCESTPLSSASHAQNSLKSFFPQYFESISSVSALGTRLSPTYPHSLFRVDAESNSPISCSITTDSDSKSVVVATLLPYTFSTDLSRKVSSGISFPILFSAIFLFIIT